MSEDIEDDEIDRKWKKIIDEKISKLEKDLVKIWQKQSQDLVRTQSKHVQTPQSRGFSKWFTVLLVLLSVFVFFLWNRIVELESKVGGNLV